MENNLLKVEVRDNVGTNDSKAIRNSNRVPAVVFGRHMDSPIHISLDGKDASKLLRKNNTGSSLFLDINGEETFVLLKNVQKHPVTTKTLHIDFQALKAGEVVKVSIPVYLYGKDDLRGVFCQELLSEVEIECLPKYLIDKVEIELGDAQDGDQLTVGELDIFKSGDITAITEEDAIIYVISELREVEIEEDLDEETDEEITEPELIGEESEEDSTEE